MPKLVKYFHALNRYCAMDGRKGKVKVHLNLTSLHLANDLLQFDRYIQSLHPS